MARSKFVVTSKDRKIAYLARKTDDMTLVAWASDCAERVLPYFEAAYPDDKRPRLAIEAGRNWAHSGSATTPDELRRAALAANAAAGAAPRDTPSYAAGRAAGHVVSTTHVADHAIVAARYAATAVNGGLKAFEDDAPVLLEREWQYGHLVDLRARHSLVPSDSSVATSLDVLAAKETVAERE